jgi:hypothetical protein
MERQSSVSSVETIKRRLKRRDAWHYNYLDNIVESIMRLKQNELANKGPRAQVEFLLRNGCTIKEIVKEGRSVRRYIRTVMSTMTTSKKKKHH